MSYESDWFILAIWLLASILGFWFAWKISDMLEKKSCLE